jgi:hypothetical protein
MEYVLSKATDAVEAVEAEGKPAEDATYKLVHLEKRIDADGKEVMIRVGESNIRIKDIDNQITLLNADIIKIQNQIAAWEQMKANAISSK